MMQMHVLLSSSEDHFLFTYTDLAGRFESNEEGFLDDAFSTAQTIAITAGSAPAEMTFLTILFSLLEY